MKFQTLTFAGNEPLNRVQANVAQALRDLEADIDASIAVAIAAIPTSGLSVTAFGSAPNAAAASVSGTALTLQPADATNPGGISTGNQTFPGTGFVKTHTAQNDFETIIRLKNTTSIQFNYSSAHAIRYAGNVLTGLQFIGDNFEFQPNTSGGQLYYPELLRSDRYGVIGKDDQSATPGNFTTTASAGRAAFALGATTVVITNNTANRAFAATDDVYLTFLDFDATLTEMKFVAAANTITITGNAAATAACRFAWFVIR